MPPAVSFVIVSVWRDVAPDLTVSGPASSTLMPSML